MLEALSSKSSIPTPTCLRLYQRHSLPGSAAGPTAIEFDPNFQVEMIRQNSRLIELMDRRLNAEEKRREQELERLRMFHLLDRLVIHLGPVE